MTINDNTLIDVHNFTDGCISVTSNIRPEGYLFEPATNGNPFVLQLAFIEVRGINTQSNVFREGFLRFDPEKEEEIYKALNIREWTNILTDEDIKSAILEPTKAKLERLIKIDSASLFERVRGMATQLDNSGAYDVSTRVKNAINERYKELYAGKRGTGIVIRETAAEIKAKEEEAQKKQLDELLAEERAKIEAEVRATVMAEIKAKEKEKKASDAKSRANNNQDASKE